ncbi:hypothetical protein NKH18_10690 [Streptomyces sp. M10(2022)]
MIVAIAYSAVADHLDRVVSLSDEQDVTSHDIVPLVTAFGLLVLAGVITMTLVSSLMYAAVPAILQDAVLGRPVGLATVWRRAWARVAALIGTLMVTSLIAVVPVVLAMVAFVGITISLITLDSGSGGSMAISLGFLGVLATAPLAVWLWTKFCLAPSVVVFEGQGPIAAMRRSSQLVRGDWWRIFGISLLVYVMAMVAGYVIQMPFSFLGLLPGMIGTSSLDSDPNTAAVAVAMGGYLVAMMLGQLISQVVSTTFPQLVIGLLYVDRRIRTENLGPVLAQAAGAPPQAGPASG